MYGRYQRGAVAGGGVRARSTGGRSRKGPGRPRVSDVLRCNLKSAIRDFVYLGTATLGLSTTTALAAERHPSLEGGVGLGLLDGGSGNGYGIGASERVGVDIPAGPIHSIALAAEHAHHAVVRAGAYLPGAIVPDDAIEGFRDRWNFSLGGRFQLQLADPAADRLVVEPLAELAMSLVATHSAVVMPGFDARTTLGSWNLAPGLCIGVGADIRVRRFLAFIPAFRMTAAFEEDQPESGGAAVPGAEARGDVSLSARVTW